MPAFDPEQVAELSRRAHCERWSVTEDRFGQALARSLDKAGGDARLDSPDALRYLRNLHLDDLALACACEDGHEGAWEYFVREFRPQLYRAAAAIDPSGESRDLADTLYADLFGLKERDGTRQSLFRYFHGRSSLGTWLRSVLAQRHVDRVRAGRRLEPLDDAHTDRLASGTPAPSPDTPRHLAALAAALTAAIAALADTDRLRLACYHAQNLTLAQIGRLMGEHEATVSRHLTRARRAIRQSVEAALRTSGMDDAEIRECFSAAVEDEAGLGLEQLLSRIDTSKVVEPDRSRVRRP